MTLQSTPYSGPLSQYLASGHDTARPREERERRWHRAHMRAWAGFWRKSSAIAAALGKPVEDVAAVHLAVAKSYRDHSR